MSSEEHEVVSIYPFTDDEREELLTKATECTFNWSTKDGWPVGVIHAFVWKDGRGWITCGAHRHRVLQRRPLQLPKRLPRDGFAPRRLRQRRLQRVPFRREPSDLRSHRLVRLHELIHGLGDVGWNRDAERGGGRPRRRPRRKPSTPRTSDVGF